MVDISKIFVVDNIFPDYVVSSFANKLQNTNRWEYGIQGRLGSEKDGRFFSIWVHKPHEYSDPFEKDVDGICSYVHDAFCEYVLPSTIPDAYPTQLYRVHFNGQVAMDAAVPIHYDWEMPDYWTMIYYVGGVDGDTVFYNEPTGPSNLDSSFEEIYRVKFKPGRLVFFPSYYWHAALHPTSGLRTSCAISYRLSKCKANDEIRLQRGMSLESTLDVADAFPEHFSP